MSALIAGCAIILLGTLLLDRRLARLGDGALCALLAGVGTLLPGLAAARMQPYPAFLALLSSCVAVLCAPAMRLVLRWRPGRPVGADERACAALLAFALLTGLCALWPPGASRGAWRLALRGALEPI